MRLRSSTVLSVLGATAILLAARGADGLTACTAASISAQDPGCPAGAGPCTITKSFDVPDGCTLDFGSRAVTIASSGELDIAAGTVTIRAANFTVGPGGFVDGRGNQSSPPRNRGGMLTVVSAGAAAVQRSGSSIGRIDVSGNVTGGSISIEAGGAVRIDGKVNADGLSAAAGGGVIRVRATGDIASDANSVISAQGGSESPGGGTVDFVAGGKIDLGAVVRASGSDGGLVDLKAGAEAIVRGAEVIGVGDAGSGGCVEVSGGTAVQLLGDVVARGTGSSTGTGGGCGGFVCVESQFGDLTVGASINAEGADPDGGGGQIGLVSRASLSLQVGTAVSARANGTQGDGGDVELEAGLDVTSSGTVDASGGSGGGAIDIVAGRDAAFPGGTVTAAGRNAGSVAGDISIEAGANGPGTLTVSGVIDATGGACGTDVGCGTGGFADLAGCDVSVTASGSVLARAPDAGYNSVIAYERLTIAGRLDASTTTGTGSPGQNLLEHPSRTAPVLSGSIITPPAAISALATCTAPNTPAGCLLPCPNCGNGVTEFPETCDNAVGTPVSCDGCSIFCQVENCDDGLACTFDSCNPQIGCRHVSAPTTCLEPTRTFTPVIFSPTVTRTPSVTSTPTVTRTPTPTLTASNTATHTSTPTPTYTPTATHTATVTRTPTETATAGRTETAGPLCANGTAMVEPALKIRQLGPPIGDEKLIFKGGLAFVPGVPPVFDPLSTGAQILVEDLGAGEAAVFDLTHLTHPIPPGGIGTGCDPLRDGWQVNNTRIRHAYRNASDAIDPPACTFTSANGLKLLKFRDTRATKSVLKFLVKAKQATIASPIGPLRATIVLGATASAGAAGECAVHAFSTLGCRYNSSRTALICR